MGEILKALLSADSKLSSMRVMGFVALFSAVGIAIFGLATDKNPDALALLCGTFLGAAFGGKAVQSFAEKSKGAE